MYSKLPKSRQFFLCGFVKTIHVSLNINKKFYAKKYLYESVIIADNDCFVEDMRC